MTTCCNNIVHLRVANKTDRLIGLHHDQMGKIKVKLNSVKPFLKFKENSSVTPGLFLCLRKTFMNGKFCRHAF